MNGDNYLTEFKRAATVDLSGGMGGWLRRRLDRSAASLDQVDRHALFLPRVLDLVGLALTQPRIVLEIGCGSGWAISYRHENLRYVAIDRGSVFRSELEKRQVTFHELDVSSAPIPLADASVDLVVLNHLIEHIPASEFLIGQLHRVVKPGGVVYIRTPDIARVKWQFWDDYTHVKPFTVGGLNHLMNSFEFSGRFMFHSDHPRIIADIMTRGMFRGLLFGRLFGGKEIEAAYVREA